MRNVGNGKLLLGPRVKRSSRSKTFQCETTRWKLLRKVKLGETDELYCSTHDDMTTFKCQTLSYSWDYLTSFGLPAYRLTQEILSFFTVFNQSKDSKPSWKSKLWCHWLKDGRNFVLPLYARTLVLSKYSRVLILSFSQLSIRTLEYLVLVIPTEAEIFYQDV